MSFKNSLANKSFLGHLIAQFSVAFNDNYFKQVVLFFAARKLFPDQDRQGVGIMVFSVPFIFFSGYAGQISEKFSKQRIVLIMKVFEIFVAVMAAVALHLASWPLLLSVLFFLGLQSTIMSPAKYAILPEIVEPRELLSSNSLISILTFTGILLGLAAAGPAFDFLLDQAWVMGAFCVVLALIGLYGAFSIEPTPPQKPRALLSWDPFRGLLAGYRVMTSDRRVMVIALMNAMLWMTGAALVQAITAYGAERYLDISLGQTWKLSVLFVVLTVSIVGGCLVVPRLSYRNKTGRLMTLGLLGAALGLVTFTQACTWLGGDLGYGLALVSISTIGFSAAFALVPIQTCLQALPPPGSRGQTIALNNVLSFLGMFVAGLLYDLGSRLQLNPGGSLILIIGILIICLWRWRPWLHEIELPDVGA